ncbi:MAG: ribonuclease HI family protein [Pyramidobacter sp.]|jgi:ribonuclease HI
MIRGHFDGASRGNPGISGAGAVIYDDNRILWRCAEPLGVHTNNEAEYLALAILAAELKRRGLHGVEICGDSKLVISQVTGLWQIKEPRLRELALPVIQLVKELGAQCRWVPRSENAEADRLSNWALDQGALRQDAAAAGDGLMKTASEAVKRAAPLSVRQASDRIWIVADGREEYAVDVEHGCCSCEKGRKDGRCRHMEAVLNERASSRRKNIE